MDNRKQDLKDQEVGRTEVPLPGLDLGTLSDGSIKCHDNSSSDVSLKLFL